MSLSLPDPGSAPLDSRIYQELRRMAHARVGRPTADSLCTTALVHEAWLRLAGVSRKTEDRRYFFAAAAESMRRIVIDHARKRRAQRRGGDRREVPLSSVGAVDLTRPDELIALDAALERLQRRDPRKARVVELRYFVGLTVEETAEALSVSPRTVNSDWTFARAWLHRELSDV